MSLAPKSAQKSAGGSSKSAPNLLADLPAAPGYLRQLVELGSTVRPVVDIITFATSKDYAGCKLSPKQEQILREFFDPAKNYHELLLIIGRRGTKTFLTSIIAAYVAYLWEEIPDPYSLFSGILAQGTDVYITVIATKPKQARNLLKETKAKIENSPYFKDKIVKNDAELEIRLKNGLIIQAATSNSAGEVGTTNIMVAFDEIGKYGTMQGTRDGEEVYDTMSACITTFVSNKAELLKRAGGDPGLERIIKFIGIIACISTPMSESGILWKLYTDYLKGLSPSTLMYQMPTWEINPNVPRDGAFLRERYGKSPEKFEREFGAQFSKALGGMFEPELVNACMGQIIHKYERFYNYRAALDSSTNSDGFAFSIGHLTDTGKVIVDLLKIWKPVKGHGGVLKLDWGVIMPEIKNDLRTYQVETTYYDQYQSEAIKLHLKSFSKRLTTFTMQYKMKIYGLLEKLMHQGQIEYPPHKILIDEMKALERKWNGENFTVHHPKTGLVTTDDGPDAVANLAFNLFEKHVREHDDEDDDSPGSNREWTRDELDDGVLFGGGGYH